MNQPIANGPFDPNAVKDPEKFLIDIHEVMRKHIPDSAVQGCAALIYAATSITMLYIRQGVFAPAILRVFAETMIEAQKHFEDTPPPPMN